MRYQPLDVADLRTKAAMHARFTQARNNVAHVSQGKNLDKIQRQNNIRKLRLDAFVARLKVRPEPSAPVEPVDPNKPVTVTDIIKAVCRRSGLPSNEILSPRRNRLVVYWRQIGMYIAKKHTSRSLPEIGRRFDGRDHSTVHYAVHKLAAEMLVNEKLARDIAAVEAML